MLTRLLALRVPPKPFRVTTVTVGPYPGGGLHVAGYFDQAWVPSAVGFLSSPHMHMLASFARLRECF